METELRRGYSGTARRKGRPTDNLDLRPPRHISTLPSGRTSNLLPNLRTLGLKGGVRYWNAQFDDARLAVALARTAVAQGAAVLNHCPAVRLLRDGKRVCGAAARDAESGEVLELHASCVVNATGVRVDAVRDMDRDSAAPHKHAMVASSRGVHLVVDREFLPGEHALIVPRTKDGRVLFAAPWLGKTILGTTDTPRDDVPIEPTPLQHEVGFILREAGRHLAKVPGVRDVRSAWAGLRSLVRACSDDGDHTKSISREHTVAVSPTGLVTVTGGKWTTYRAMAEDVLDRCFDEDLLPPRPAGATLQLRLAGSPESSKGRIAQPPRGAPVRQ